MQVIINQGVYRGEEVHNQAFELVADPKPSKKGIQVTVRPNNDIGGDRDKIRVTVHSLADIIYPEGVTPAQPTQIATAVSNAIAPKIETDAEITARIADRFEILDEMTKAAINADIRGMILVGPPGIGKSFGVIKQLEKANLFNQISDEMPKYEILKGHITAIGLYIKLYQNSAPKQVVVFDDSDGILQEEESLNLLKAALDSGKKRKLCWNSDSSALRKEGIPDNFDFKGSVIFITNINFNNIRSKKLHDHLKALRSRTHYLDLAMNSVRDCMLRIRHIHSTGDLFGHFRFKGNEGDEIVQFMEDNKDRLDEVSLRMAVLIADLVKMNSKIGWKRLAETTLIGNTY